MSDRGNRGPIVCHDRMNGKNFAKSAHNVKMPSPLKRKTRSELKLTNKARKKAKTESGSLAVIDALPWRTLSHAGVFGNAYDDGILELEEVDNVQVVYDETPGGRLATFKVRSSQCDLGGCIEWA